MLDIGAFQAFGDVPTALARLRQLARPGGRVLLGYGYGEDTPDDEELAAQCDEGPRDQEVSRACSSADCTHGLIQDIGKRARLVRRRPGDERSLHAPEGCSDDRVDARVAIVGRVGIEAT